MILGILPDAAHTEILLDNLSEADFDLSDVSVILQDEEVRNSLASDPGPLGSVEPDQVSAALVHLGVSKENADTCQRAVNEGKVLVTMNVDEKYRAAAEEMFKDHSAQLIK
ncbi:MAG TPA: hypothetical protein VHM28_11370 [Anaerolineales bacterium]|jgi:hypothetical protein|nr:hypothetical protein [Anaerolineales bacterium]